MIDFLENIDIQMFIFLNGFHSPFWDIVMWYVSNTITWLPVYAIILFFVFRQLKWKGFITFLLLILLIVIADQGSVHLFKNVFERLRPCHNPALAGLVHIVNGKCGGQFGFISSHAANTFSFALFMALFFRRRWFSVLIFIWAAFVSYSRIYLGVHYPFDIIGGAIFGMIAGYGIFRLHQLIVNKYIKEKKPL